ncbi:MAG: hypothetical protein KJO23_01825 [Bacteroidia bacterium]|nr:hypothetical protein [Bacteroidia bacterium]
MRKLIIMMIVLVTGFAAGAQDFGNNYGIRQFTNDLFQLDEYIKRQNKGIDFEDTASYVGTPYNHPDYLMGNVYKNDSLWASNVALRYNAIADEMEIKESLNSPNVDARVLTKSPDVFVKIMKDIYIFAPYKGGIEGGGYFQVLFEGDKIGLFKKPKKSFTPEKKASTSITRDLPASFKDKPVYYIVDKNGKYYELPSSRTKKLKVFGANEKAIKAYVRQYGLDLNKENDLLRVIKHYDTF